MVKRYKEPTAYLPPALGTEDHYRRGILTVAEPIYEKFLISPGGTLS